MSYQNELRAVGDVLVDQYAFMRQCGFDAFLIAEGRALESWQKGPQSTSILAISGPIADGGLNILSARHRAGQQAKAA